ncbi:MAG: hypothetical protein ACJ77I_11080 [Chloroflexota bacterium]
MHRTAMVNGSRLILTMLLIAAVVLLGIAIAIGVLGDPPEVDGWLRAAFGKVFGVVAVALAAVLGIPAAIGLWAMAGSTAEGAEPALPPLRRQILVAVAIVTVVVTAAVLVVTGSVAAVLNLGLFALVAMASLGLAGAINFSPHGGRAAVCAIALVLVAAGSAWLLSTAFIGTVG